MSRLCSEVHAFRWAGIVVPEIVLCNGARCVADIQAMCMALQAQCSDVHLAFLEVIEV